MTTDRAEGMSAALDTAEGRRLLEKATADKIAEAVEGFGAAFYNQSRNDNASSAQIDFASALLSACVEFASVIRKDSHNG